MCMYVTCFSVNVNTEKVMVVSSLLSPIKDDPPPSEHKVAFYRYCVMRNLQFIGSDL